MCVDDLANCPFVSDGRSLRKDARRWRTGAIELPPGAMMVRVSPINQRLSINRHLSINHKHQSIN